MNSYHFINVCSFSSFILAKVNIVFLFYQNHVCFLFYQCLSHFPKYHSFFLSLSLSLSLSLCAYELLPLTFFFLSQSLFTSYFSLRFFQLTYFCFKFIIHSNTNLDPPPEQGVFFLKWFLSLFVLQEPSIYSPINEIFLWGTFPCRYRRLYSPKSICSPHCQRTNPIDHRRPKKQKKSRRKHPKLFENHHFAQFQ